MGGGWRTESGPIRVSLAFGRMTVADHVARAMRVVGVGMPAEQRLCHGRDHLPPLAAQPIHQHRHQRLVGYTRVRPGRTNTAEPFA